jgi:flagellar hook protein FlgE
MSINSALLAGVSGLVANSSALAAISDNIANVNTVAYKRNQVNFANVVTAQGVKGKYSAGGVQAIARQFVSQQGLIQSSGSATDLAISGDGFFVVASRGTGLTAADPRAFTRQGSFSVDADGFLKNDANLYLQGWPVQPDGTFDINPSDLSAMSSINVKNLGSAVAATTSVEITANLNAGQVLSPAVGSAGPPVVPATYNPATNASMSSYAAGAPTGTQPDFVIPLNVIDSQGAQRRLEIAFLKSQTANEWFAEVYAVPASSVDVAGPSGQIRAGTVAFNTDGTLDPANTDLFGAGVTTMTLDASGGAQPNWADALGIGAQTIDFDLANVTQQAANSTVTSIAQDGAGVGSVVAVEVSEDGIVSAIYDNSQIRTIAKIGIATFPNPDGLQAVSGNSFRPTRAAGVMLVKEPGIAGAGNIAPSSLEASTVDLSAEFTGLIQTQKAYSASSRIITTADQMLEELINIKR